MWVTINIKNEMVAALDDIARAEGVSRAALVRQAIADCLAERQRPDDHRFFGLWTKGSDIVVDGLIYQTAMREEW